MGALLNDGVAIVGLWPEDGGAVGAYSVRRGQELTPFFQNDADASRRGPFARGYNALMPTSPTWAITAEKSPAEAVEKSSKPVSVT